MSAAERYEFESPYKNIKNLKAERLKLTPFLWKRYIKILPLFVKISPLLHYSLFFTGMRTSEIDGLQWKISTYNVVKSISRSVSEWVLGGTKTYGSDRTIQMSDRVYQAFLQQKSLNNGKSSLSSAIVMVDLSIIV